MAGIDWDALMSPLSKNADWIVDAVDKYKWWLLGGVLALIYLFIR